MGPLTVKTDIKKEDIKLKKGNVGKLKAEVRRKGIDANTAKHTVKNNYFVNKAKQVNKIVVKNKIAAPVSVETHANDVYISYSPAIFKISCK